MKLPLWRRSLRFRLMLACLLVEGVLLAILVGNSLRLIQQHLVLQTERRVAVIEQAYKTAVSVPLASRDYATLRDILDGWKQAEDIAYLVVTDTQGKVLSAAGWPEMLELPAASREMVPGEVFHVKVPVAFMGQSYGVVHYGLKLDFLALARQDLFVQGSLIALGEITLSFIVLFLVGLWLTRDLGALSAASQRIAQGDYKTGLLVRSEDELGILARSFNQMSEAIDIRIRALAESEARQRALISAMGEGVYGIDSQGLCTYINPAALEMLGFSETEVLGKNQHELFHHSRIDGAHYPVELCPISLTLTDGLPRREEEVFWNKSGEPIPVLLSATGLQQAGRVYGAIVVFVDLREQKAVETLLRQARDAAEVASRAKSQFLSTMSHELRTPMNAILGMAQLLEMTALSEEQKSYLKTIHVSAGSLLDMINDILDFSKLEAGKVQLESIPFSPRAVFDEIDSLFKHQFKEKGLGLRIRVADDIPDLVLGDPVRLRQILANLVSNGMKFTIQGELSLSLSARCQEPDRVWLDIQVRDTGIGMSKDVLDQLFTPFFQADASISRRFGGTGLGLCICQHFVNRMSGTMTVNSTPGVGTEFQLAIPFLRA